MFVNKIINNIGINEKYHVFVKIRYCVDSFAMCGNQFAFGFTHNDDIHGLQEIV